jgi:hypothetical protein
MSKSDMNADMNIRDWRISEKLTVPAILARLDLQVTERTWHRMERGQTPVDADVVERIVAMTGGAVTVQDMHDLRLEFLKGVAA